MTCTQALLRNTGDPDQGYRQVIPEGDSEVGLSHSSEEVCLTTDGAKGLGYLE